MTKHTPATIAAALADHEALNAMRCNGFDPLAAANAYPSMVQELRYANAGGDGSQRQNTPIALLLRELATLRAQRDELLAALAELLDCHVPGACGSRTYLARERARIALGKDMP